MFINYFVYMLFFATIIFLAIKKKSNRVEKYYKKETHNK